MQIGDALAISVGLDPRAFNKGSTEVRNSLRKTREAANKEAASIEQAMDKAAESFARLTRNAVKLFAIFTAGRAVSAFASDISNADAAMGRLAQRIGQAPADIAAMSAAVARTGGSMDAAANSFQSFSDSIQELKATGNTSILPFLYKVQAAGGKTINLNKDIAQTYIDLADNLKNISDRQGSAAANYYGRQLGLDPGTVALMVEGGEALKKYVEESRKLGSATKEDTDAAQRYQRAMARLHQTVEGLGRSIMTTVTPMIVEAVNYMQKWIVANKAWIQTEIVDRIKAFGEYLRSIDWKAVEEGIKSFISGANDAAKAVGGWKTVAELFFGLWAASKMAAIFAPILGSIATVRLALMRLGPIGWALLGVGSVGAALAEADPNKAIVHGGKPGGGQNPGDVLPGLGGLGERDGGARTRSGMRARAARGASAKDQSGGVAANPGDYKDVLDHIARSEGTAKAPGGGYNTSLANGLLLPGGKEQDLTKLTLDQIDALQTGMLRNPKNRWNSSAIGRYQVVRTTLRDQRAKLGLKGSDLYDQKTQDLIGANLARQTKGDPIRLRNEWASLVGVKNATAVELMRKVPRRASPVPKVEPKPSAWNGYPGASDAITAAHSAQAANVQSRTMNDNRSTSTSEANFNGGIHVHTAATTGDGIAAELQDSIRRKSFATAANYGQA